MEYTDRELEQLSHAINYANNHAEAGVPGHSQFMLIAKLVDNINQLEKQLDEVYRDRNTVVQLAAVLAARGKLNMGLGRDPREPDWPVVYIELPNEGQVSWHVNSDDLLAIWPIFHPTDWRIRNTENGVWDGHTTEEKMTRVKKFVIRNLVTGIYHV